MNPGQENKTPSYADIIRDILAHVNGPVSNEDLIDQILQRHPSTAKNPHKAVLTKIREEQGKQLVFLDVTHVLPIRLAYQGARYRIRLTQENVDKATLSIFESFHHYSPISFKPENFIFIDSQGTPIPFQVPKTPDTAIFSSEKKVEYQEPVVILKEWFRSQKIYHKDHILVTIEDWEQGIFRLERERFGDQRPELLAERNRFFADAIFALLEMVKSEDIFVHIALPTIYAKMPDKGGYPPDHWMVIVDNDPRLASTGWSIRYADSGFSMLDQILAQAMGQSLAAPVQPYTKEEGQQVYKLRAHLARKPEIWREVEIRGKQTVEDLDTILRIAFQHDTSDHLSGFWKKVARTGGSRKRYREVDIGTVNPFESGEGSDTAIAALKLQVGDQLKYVYDFGDWIEHTLQLQSISKPEKGVRYPREVASNKPKYEYCVECQEKGKQTIASWVCITCSNEEQRDVLLCEECLENHEDHYTDEILY